MKGCQVCYLIWPFFVQFCNLEISQVVVAVVGHDRDVELCFGRTMFQINDNEMTKKKFRGKNFFGADSTKLTS